MKMFTVVLALVFSCAAQAGGEFTFHGFLLTPPECVISNDSTVEVDFKNVRIDDVDGNNFKQNVPYTIDCDTDWRDSSMVMSLTLTGTASDFNTAALKTNIDDFAIAVYQDGKPFTLGSTITVNEASKPVIQVVPIKKAGSQLVEGNFEAWATLRVDYQ